MPSLTASDPYTTHARFECRHRSAVAPTNGGEASTNSNDFIYRGLTLRRRCRRRARPSPNGSAPGGAAWAPAGRRRESRHDDEFGRFEIMIMERARLPAVEQTGAGRVALTSAPVDLEAPSMAIPAFPPAASADAGRFQKS